MPKSFDWWAGEFSAQIGCIGKILILICSAGSNDEALGDVFSPYCFKRAWCIYEYYASIKTKCSMEIAMNPTDEAKLQHLASSADCETLFTHIRRLLNFSTAEASKDNDLLGIQHAIQFDVGYNHVEWKIYSSLMNVFLRKLGLYSKQTLLDFEQQKGLEIIMRHCFEKCE